MLREELRPCLVTSLTTAAGYGSFAFSRIEPLRALGITMAVSILVAFAVAWFLLPALLVLLRPHPSESLRIGALLRRVVPPVLARRPLVLAASALVVAAGVLSVPHVPRETNGLNYLPADGELRTETERLRREGVGTASLEIILERGGEGALTLAREAAYRTGLGSFALAEKLALIPAPGPFEAELAAYRDTGRRRARASLRIDAIDAETHARLQRRVDEAVAAALADRPGASYSVTGEFPIILTVQEELLGTLLRSILATAATILLVISLAHGSLRIGFVTMLPALVPFGFIITTCALTGISLSISTVMVLAVTLGIITDDSVHMLHALAKGDPVPHVLANVGTAVAETSIALFLGFAVLSGADFPPTRDFGLLTAAGVAAAFAADLLLFPVLLLRPAPAGEAPVGRAASVRNV